WFGEQEEETRPLILVTRQNVSGLNMEAQVRYRGIRVGKVTGIRIDPEDPNNILIQTEVSKQVPLTHGLTAGLAYQGITGIAHILLEGDGNNPQALRPEEGQDIPRIVMRPSLFDRLDESLPIMLSEIQSFLKNANALLDSGNRQRLANTLANLEASSTRVNETMTQVQTLLSDRNVADLSRALRETAPIMEETRQMMTRLNTVAGRVDRLLQDNDAHGEASNIALRVNRMADELTLTSRQLKRVLEQLEEAPQSLILGTPAGRPGPGEPGFSTAATSESRGK
ncbi:MAG: MlaD family protein, partial [Zoogloeaceae bacterium]|nr:MlaD family protein [Zoogloeaceae bacterium]